jgi:hypothetical protein
VRRRILHEIPRATGDKLLNYSPHAFRILITENERVSDLEPYPVESAVCAALKKKIIALDIGVRACDVKSITAPEFGIGREPAVPGFTPRSATESVQ